MMARQGATCAWSHRQASNSATGVTPLNTAMIAPRLRDNNQVVTLALSPPSLGIGGIEEGKFEADAPPEEVAAKI